MLVVHVHVHVKPEGVEDFVAATKENAAASLKEPGIARFDLIQSRDDPTRFVLVEAYKDEGAPAAHKQTAHYAAWRDRVEPLLAEPRSSAKFESLYPEAERWGTPG